MALIQIDTAVLLTRAVQFALLVGVQFKFPNRTSNTNRFQRAIQLRLAAFNSIRMRQQRAVQFNYGRSAVQFKPRTIQF